MNQTTEAKDKTANELIAEFYNPEMEVYGFQEKHYNRLRARYKVKQIRQMDALGYTTQLPPFDTSWDALMHVVEKIPTLNPDNGRGWFEWEMSRGHCHIWGRGSYDQLTIRNNGGTTLDATYKSVVEFIRWYNANQPKQNEGL